MELRSHPLMSYQSIRNWPPLWIWTGGTQNKQAEGEVGILKSVVLVGTEPFNKCYLIIEHDGEQYVGCLLFGNSSFCRQVYRVLDDNCGVSLQHIGGIDVNYSV
jgi:hypothetical protein